jgi:hypothetical protein
MGLGHTGLEQGITRAHNDNRPGVTVQETRYNFVVSYVGTQHLDELGHSVHERDYQAHNDTRPGHTVQGLPQVLKLGGAGHSVQGSWVY